MIKYLLPFIFISNLALGDDAVSLSKGQSAPFDGILMTTDRAQSARKAELDLPQYKLLNDSLSHSLDLEKDNNSFLTQKVGILTNDNQLLSTSLEKERSTNELTKILWFAGGVILTALAVKGASQLR